MKKSKREKLEAAGWKVGSAAAFLGLTDDEAALVEIKLGLSNLLKKERVSRRWTQTYVAKILESSQSRVARMEAGDPSVSMDLLMRALFRMGKSKEEVAGVIFSPSAAQQSDPPDGPSARR